MYVYFGYYHLHNNLQNKDRILYKNKYGECSQRSFEVTYFIVDLTFYPNFNTKR